MSKYKVGIFDHSGVLSDDRKPVHASNVVLLERYCPGVKNPSFDDWLKMSHASAGEFIQSQGGKAPLEEINREYENVYRAITSRADSPILPTMYPQVPGVLDQLRIRGMKTAIVSSHPKSSLFEELERYGIKDKFDLISGDPAPKDGRLIEICDSLKVGVKDAFFVEDTIYGLQAAERIGMDGFGVTTGYHSRDRLEAEKQVKVVDSLTELLLVV